MIQDLELGSLTSLYFHLPFCSKKCPYCHFYVTKTKLKSQEDFFVFLKKEWLQKLPLLKDRSIYSIYFGGGTPSQVPLSLLEPFFNLIFSSNLTFHKDLEITFEANPEDLSKHYLKDLKTLPINRLSIGVQSFHDDTLKILDRQHDSQKAIQAILDSHEMGFANISIDLMYDLPHQTTSSWEHTLNITKTLPIAHLSLYNLTIEPQTVFYKKKKELEPFLPNDAKSLLFLSNAIETFESIGLHRYEISAFAKKGFHSKHNVGYWLGREFHGYGPAAFSYFEGKRFKNISDINKYASLLEKNQTPIDFEEKLEEEPALRESLAIRLRLKEGVKLSTLPSLPSSLEKELSTLIQEDFLLKKENLLSLTQKGFLFYDTVAATII